MEMRIEVGHAVKASHRSIRAFGQSQQLVAGKVAILALDCSQLIKDFTSASQNASGRSTPFSKLCWRIVPNLSPEQSTMRHHYNRVTYADGQKSYRNSSLVFFKEYSDLFHSGECPFPMVWCGESVYNSCTVGIACCRPEPCGPEQRIEVLTG
jgi:hypothetical protein